MDTMTRPKPSVLCRNDHHKACARKEKLCGCICHTPVRKKPSVAANPRVEHAYLQRDARATSVAARFDTLPRSGTARYRVLLFIYNKGTRGATDEEMRNALAMRYSTQCARRLELVEGEWIEDSGRTRLTEAGNGATVWVMSSEGRRKMVAE